MQPIIAETAAVLNDSTPVDAPIVAGLAVLLLFSGFFSGSETALFSLPSYYRRILKQRSGFASRAVDGLIRDKTGLLVTVLLGNMVVNVMYCSLSVVLSHRIAKGGWALPVELAFLAILITVGEIVPKTIAVTIPQATALAVAVPLTAFKWAVTLPRRGLERVARAITGAILSVVTPAHSPRKEVEMAIEVGVSDMVIAEDEADILRDVVELSEIRVREVMTPRVDVVAHQIDAPDEQLLALFTEHRKKRIPLYISSIDDVKYFVSAKDFAISPDADIKEIRRPIAIIPEYATVETALKRMTETGEKFFVVVDEYGGTEGILTPNDILEEIVGEIADEYERVSPGIVRLAQDRYLVSGRFPVRDWNEKSRVKLEFDEHTSTIGGYLAAELDKVPEMGDEIRVGDSLTFKVLRVKDKAVSMTLAVLIGETLDIEEGAGR